MNLMSHVRGVFLCVAVPAALGAAAEPAAAPARKLRDPFLPVNYSRPVSDQGTDVAMEPPVASTNTVSATGTAPDWALARKRLVVGAVSRYRRPGSDKDVYAALVNGRLVEAGDVVSVVMGGFRYQWRVRDIGPQGISFNEISERESPPR